MKNVDSKYVCADMDVTAKVGKKNFPLKQVCGLSSFQGL